MNVGIAADHNGFAFNERLVKSLRGAGFEVVDFGAEAFAPGDDCGRPRGPARASGGPGPHGARHRDLRKRDRCLRRRR
jgi:hypothetical protein